jgi:hypothetical protein
MPTSPPIALRFRTISRPEHLLAAAHVHKRQFSEEELQMVESYAMEVAKMNRDSADTMNHSSHDR